MNARRSRLLALVAVLVLAGPARAEVTGIKLTLSPHAGMALWDNTQRLDDQLVFGGRGGLAFGRWIAVEGTYNVSWTKTDAVPAVDVRANHVGADLVVKLWRPAVVVPYVLGGWTQVEFDPDAGETQSFNGWEAGGGLLLRLAQRWHVRLEARDVMIERDAPLASDLTHNIFVTGGLQWTLGGKVKDTDGDGVGDHRDRCPDTPLGAIVDAHGCPSDGDGDGVWDGLDRCADTPARARVDARGCPTDADGDGVWDGLDLCADTPKGAKADARGCPTDADGDGVWDGLDQCASTPTGARVNDLGCPLDSDGDGVYDGLDQCENTPASLRVDVHGCPIEVSEKEVQLLDTGMIRLNNINFETAKWDIKPESFAALDEVGNILVQWPQLQIEIGGHTDARGSEAYNQELSQKRAQAVLEYLAGKFPNLGAGQYTARGYGESTPIAANDTETGRALNRRVEFKVLNTETLRKEIERRKLLRKD